MKHGDLMSPIRIAFKHVEAASNIAYPLWQPMAAADERAVLGATIEALGEARRAIEGALGVAEGRVRELER